MGSGDSTATTAGLTTDELSALSGEPLEDVRRWAELGLLPGEEGTLPRRTPLDHSSSLPIVRRLRTVEFAGCAVGVAPAPGGGVTGLAPTSARNFPLASYSRRYCSRLRTTPCT